MFTFTGKGRKTCFEERRHPVRRDTEFVSADNQTAACCGDALGNLSWIFPQISVLTETVQHLFHLDSATIKTIWNTCLLVCIVYEAAATRGVLFTCCAEPSTEVVMSGVSVFCAPNWTGAETTPTVPCDREQQWERWVCSGNSTESQHINLSSHWKRDNHWAMNSLFTWSNLD